MFLSKFEKNTAKVPSSSTETSEPVAKKRFFIDNNDCTRVPKISNSIHLSKATDVEEKNSKHTASNQTAVYNM